MSIAAYLRISSDKQDVTRQRDSITAWEKRSGNKIAEWYEDTQGKNPRDLAHKRAAFQRLMAAVRAGQVSCIVVDSQDRFGGRDAIQVCAFLEELRNHNCILIDASGKPISGDDDGTVFAAMIGGQASRREQKEKAHRSASGKIGKAKAGEYQGGYPPYGFDVVCFGADGNEKWRSLYVGHFDRWKVYPDGRREQFKGKDNAPVRDATDTLRLGPSIETDRLRVVKDIFQWYATEAISPRQIATRLTKCGVDPIFGVWDKVKLVQMLRNPVYIGFPSWNKRSYSRFVEYSGGELREVKAQKSKHRAKEDFLAPEKQQYEPIIDEMTWNKVQAKVADASAEQLAIPKRPPQTDELWLKPFLVCGHCNKPMRATRGGKGSRVWPSYFCGTYGTYGPENPTGCHCHRVHHDVIEKIVLDYLKEKAPQAAELLAASKGGNLSAMQPLLEAVLNSDRSYQGLACDLMQFVEDNLDESELRRYRRQGRTDVEIYGLIFEKLQPALELRIAAKESELDAMLDDFRSLTPLLRERANVRMETLQGEINELKAQLVDLRQPWHDFGKELAVRQESLTDAEHVLTNGAAGRQKTETLSGVIDQIVCRFRHTATKDQTNNGKSHLESVEIGLISGESLCLTDGNALGRG
jgi:DNA invertase Pin-like site-specific DNA recombinase